MPVSNIRDGEKYNRLLVIRKVEKSRNKWLCQCDCGNIIEVYGSRLISGHTQSCGCLNKECQSKIYKYNEKHNMSDSILYKKWCGMKERCYNPHYKYYDRYGGRGIKVCDEWLGEHGFEKFMKWAYEAGYDDSKQGYEQTIDRKDVDGNYCPDNCRWVNQIEQVKNRSISRTIIDCDGEELTASQFDKKHNINANSFTYRRIKKGYSAKQILDEWKVFKDYENGKYFLKEEAANYYNVCVSTIDKWIEKGLLKATKCRMKVFIPKGQCKPIYEDRNEDGTFKKGRK